jgi:hypothetical protein
MEGTDRSSWKYDLISKARFWTGSPPTLELNCIQLYSIVYYIDWQTAIGNAQYAFSPLISAFWWISTRAESRCPNQGHAKLCWDPSSHLATTSQVCKGHVRTTRSKLQDAPRPQTSRRREDARSDRSLWDLMRSCEILWVMREDTI